MSDDRPTELRLKVLAHIELNSEGGKYGVRVPDAWIAEANASVVEGQSTNTSTGRRLTDHGRTVLSEMAMKPVDDTPLELEPDRLEPTGPQVGR